MRVVIATIKTWNITNAKKIKNLYNSEDIEISLITNKSELNYSTLKVIDPDYIFFPHWSWIIPPEVYDNFKCVVFHMTDLPFGRGGSPLQNLITKGIEDTKISAIKVHKGIDTGPIYLKRDLNLNGTAEEIFLRASKIIIFDMIPFIIKNPITPKKQKGEIVEFKRRSVDESEINSDLSLEQIYDYIRMLDGEGYPRAFIKFGDHKFEFSRASFKDGKIIADVIISEEE
ncbi:formyltransferase family protein [Paraliobacillus ryukyuensis]|uniref:formyltransferase family protein n=1 Tax=Paraliobacillus ryukyuensis TaxID=200904 RepID=UPI0009A67E3B|nr:formyltransferase family protein [Paraliobacillus ryukyuensis]